MDMIVNSQFIIEQRKSRAWSQQHLAEVSGLSLRTVQRIENSGSGAPDLIKAIAMAFGLVPADLMQSSAAAAEQNQLNADVKYSGVSKSLISAVAGFAFICFMGTAIWIAVGSNNNTVAVESASQHSAPATLSPEQDSVNEAARHWVQFVDSGDYLSAWRESDPLVTQQVNAQQWQQAVEPVRKTFGAVTGRSISTLSLMSEMQGLPDGEYAMVVFSTRFENKSGSFETIPMSKGSGEWRPIGYFIR